MSQATSQARFPLRLSSRWLYALEVAARCWRSDGVVSAMAALRAGTAWRTLRNRWRDKGRLQPAKRLHLPRRARPRRAQCSQLHRAELQARKNIGLGEPLTVKLQPFTKTISVPGMVVERPGRSTSKSPLR